MANRYGKYRDKEIIYLLSVAAQSPELFDAGALDELKAYAAERKLALPQVQSASGDDTVATDAAPSNNKKRTRLLWGLFGVLGLLAFALNLMRDQDEAVVVLVATLTQWVVLGFLVLVVIGIRRLWKRFT